MKEVEVKLERMMLALAVLLTLSVSAWAGDAVECHICHMKVDVPHNVHFQYEMNGKTYEIGSMFCAKEFWKKHKDQEMVFKGKDYRTGEWIDPTKAWFLWGSKMDVGTKMDKRSSAVLFEDRAEAEKAREKHGGEVITVQEVLSRLG
jgi:YHS domain-containing protein